ncbi:hypothetical protein ACLB1E_34155 [Escherichia coli]
MKVDVKMSVYDGQVKYVVILIQRWEGLDLGFFLIASHFVSMRRNFDKILVSLVKALQVSGVVEGIDLRLIQALRKY